MADQRHGLAEQKNRCYQEYRCVQAGGYQPPHGCRPEGPQAEKITYNVVGQSQYEKHASDTKVVDQFLAIGIAGHSPDIVSKGQRHQDSGDDDGGGIGGVTDERNNQAQRQKFRRQNYIALKENNEKKEYLQNHGAASLRNFPLIGYRKAEVRHRNLITLSVVVF